MARSASSPKAIERFVQKISGFTFKVLGAIALGMRPLFDWPKGQLKKSK